MSKQHFQITKNKKSWSNAAIQASFRSMKAQKITEILSKLPKNITDQYEWNAGYQWQSIETNKSNLSYCIDHTYLKADINYDKVKKLCEEAIQHQFYGVCLPPFWVGEAIHQLKNTNIKIISVANFPLGSQLLETQIYEIESLEKNCDEIDFVQPLPLVYSGQYEKLFEHFLNIKKAANGKVLKVILETSELNEEQLVASAVTAVSAKMDFLKTSTGFSEQGATFENVKLLRSLAGDHASIKASGGIRDYKNMLKFLEAGANRIGSHAGPQILGEEK